MNEQELIDLCKQYFPSLDWKIDNSSVIWIGVKAYFPNSEDDYIGFYQRVNSSRCYSEWHKKGNLVFISEAQTSIPHSVLNELRVEIYSYYKKLGSVLGV